MYVLATWCASHKDHYIRQQELHNFASNTGFIVCAWHFMYENVFKYARICAAGFTNLRSQNNNVLLSDP